MKLILAKCVFSIKAEKFLGFIVSKNDIELNLKKLKSIQEMVLPRNVKEVQKLTG